MLQVRIYLVIALVALVLAVIDTVRIGGDAVGPGRGVRRGVALATGGAAPA